MNKIDPCLQCEHHFYAKDFYSKKYYDKYFYTKDFHNKKHFCMIQGIECYKTMNDCIDYLTIKGSILEKERKTEAAK